MKRISRNVPSFEEEKNEPSKSEITHLRQMCLDLLSLNKQVEEVNEQKSKLVKSLNELRLIKIPEFAKSVGLEKEKSLKDVGDLIIKDDIKAAIPEKNKLVVHRWLRDNGHESIIDDLVIINIDDKEHRENIINTLNDNEIRYESKESIHNGRLKKFVRERIEKNDLDFDQKQFGVYHFSETKIKGVKFQS